MYGVGSGVGHAGARAPAALDAEAGAPTRSLPGELLASVFSHLDVPDRFCAAGVCRRWRQSARDPPHSVALEVTVVADVFKGDARAALRRRLARLERAAAQDPLADFLDDWRLEIERLAPLAPRALSVAQAAAVLQHPLSAGVRELALRCVAADGAGVWRADPPGHGLGALGGALGAGVAGLEVRCVDSALQLRLTLDEACAALRLAAAPCRPSLRSLVVRWEGPPDRPPFPVLRDPAAVPPLPALRYLGGTADEQTLGPLLARAPALRAVHTLRLHTAGGARAAAAAGVRCRCLLLGRGLDAAEALAAVRALWSARDEGGPAGAWLSGLEFVGCGVPPDADPAALAGADFIGLHQCALGPAALDWITRVPTLASLDLSRVRVEGVAPGAMAAALDRLRAGARVALRPAAGSSWTPADLADLLRAARASPRLATALDLDLSEYPLLPDAVALERERLWLAQAELEAGAAAATAGPPQCARAAAGAEGPPARTDLDGDGRGGKRCRRR